MSTLRRVPGLYSVVALAAVVSLGLSLLVLSGAFEPRTTIAGSIFFDACNNAGQPDDSCIRGSHWASGVAIEYRAVGLLPVAFTTHTDSGGRYRLNLPSGTYRVLIAGCKSWTRESTTPPQSVVPREPIDPDRLSDNWVIDANGTCQVGGVAL
jgi:hypothetical protein